MAQAASSQWRQRLGGPYRRGEADQFATRVLGGLDSDVRVEHDTIVVTFYNAPDAGSLAEHCAGFPNKLTAERADPHIPWLFNFKSGFRFK